MRDFGEQFFDAANVFSLKAWALFVISTKKKGQSISFVVSKKYRTVNSFVNCFGTTLKTHMN